MKYTTTLIASVLLLTVCGCGDKAEQHQIIGTWSQGTTTFTLASDGTYTSVWPEFPKGQTTTFAGKWSIARGCLVLTDVHSNSISVSDVAPSKIVSLDEHSLVLDMDGHKISLSRP
jgi:hypothetical protein